MSNSTDLALFGYVAQQGAAGHALYSFPGYAYPPLVGYLWFGAGKILAAFDVPVVVHASAIAGYAVPGVTSADLTTPLAGLTLKTPALLADAALAWAVDRACIAAGATSRARRFAVLAVWLNPIVIFDSAVQASWDAAVPATIIVAGMAATVEGSGAASGAWLALGALAKAVPIMCAPLVAATLARSTRPALRLSGAIVAAAAIAALASIPIAASGDLTALRDTLSGRTGGAAFGGFGLWALFDANALAPAATWLARNGRDVAVALASAEAAAVVVTAIAAWRAATLSVARWMTAALMTLTIVVIATPYVQPGYVVWLVPFAAILASLEDRRMAFFASALSALAFAFVLAVRAPATLAMPACWFFKLCDATAAARSGFAYAYAPGTLTPLLQLDIDLVVGVLGGAATVWFLWAGVRSWQTGDA